MSCEKVFLEQLRVRGFRLTPQREMVLSVMHQIEGFATAEEIHTRVQEHSSSVDISTVYRTLELLQGFQLVSWVELDDELRRYELLGLHGPHLHLACQSCGKVLGIDVEEVQSLVDHLAATHGFQAELDHVTIPGLCRDCQAAGNQATRSEHEHQKPGS